MVFQDELVLRRILCKLYYIQQSLDEHAQAIREQNKTLVGLRQEQRKHEKALEDARAEQARARGNVMQKEKKIKKAEKALETKVCLYVCEDGTVLRVRAQRPDLVRIEAQMKHAQRKREKAEQELEKLTQTESEQKRKLQALEEDLQTVQRAANQAQGA